MLYAWLAKEGHCGVVPLIAPGAAGAEGEVAPVAVVELPLVPQLLAARTR